MGGWFLPLRSWRLGERSFLQAIDDTSDALFDQCDIDVDQHGKPIAAIPASTRYEPGRPHLPLAERYVLVHGAIWISRQDARVAKKGKQRRAVGRRLRLLRAHHLIRKVSNTLRYYVTEFGRHCHPRRSERSAAHPQDIECKGGWMKIFAAGEESSH